MKTEEDGRCSQVEGRTKRVEEFGVTRKGVAEPQAQARGWLWVAGGQLPLSEVGAEDLEKIQKHLG